MSAYVYIDGLPNSVTESDVKTLFSTFDIVLSIHMGTTVDEHPMGIAQFSHVKDTRSRQRPAADRQPAKGSCDSSLPLRTVLADDESSMVGAAL